MLSTLFNLDRDHRRKLLVLTLLTFAALCYGGGGTQSRDRKGAGVGKGVAARFLTVVVRSLTVAALCLALLARCGVT